MASECGRTYRDDPDWQAAYDDLVAEHPDEGWAASFTRRATAVRRMHDVEKRYEVA